MKLFKLVALGALALTHTALCLADDVEPGNPFPYPPPGEEPICIPIPSCPNEEDYLLISEAVVPMCATSAVCQPPHVPPEPVNIWCNRAGMEYHCEVWPKGNVGYHWTSGGTVTLLHSGPTRSSLQAIYCNGVGLTGWVEVTVTSKAGISSNKFMSVNCGPPQQEY